MDLGNLDLFKALGRRMDWLGTRQTVLARNVANSDTPGYRPVDLRELDFRRMVETPRAHLASTNTSHLSPLREQMPYRPMEADDTADTTLAGNAVDLESEMRKVAETAVDHQTMVNLYRKHMAMLRTAIGRSGA